MPRHNDKVRTRRPKRSALRQKALELQMQQAFAATLTPLAVRSVR